MMLRFLIFAGTTEGRLLVGLLARPECALTACVATEYGREALPPQTNLTVLTGRLDTAEIAQLLCETCYDCVFDTTHPYAAAVTENIKAACEQAGAPYLRVLRAGGTPAGFFQSIGKRGAGATYVSGAGEAADYLAKTTGKALLTTGSKELGAFTAVPSYKERLFARVLPAVGSLEHCLALGFPAKNIICMQGPFSAELNAALLRQLGAEFLVTKDSGDAGGFSQKCEGARLAGAGLIIIGRPPQTEGTAPEELPRILYERWGLAPTAPKTPQAAYFPLFVLLQGKTVVVIGAGKVATRRVNTLLGFGCAIRVVAPAASEVVRRLALAGQVEWLAREYVQGDCAAGALAVAATDSRAVNRRVYEECAAANIPHSIADCARECSFYFPGVAQKGGVVAGVTAGGKNHKLAAELTKALEKIIGNLQLTE